MATQWSMLDIMNAALLSQGQDEIVSENDGTPEFRVLMRNWPLIVEAELEAGQYQFTKQEAALTNQVTGKFGFTYGYEVPLGTLHVRHLWLPVEGARNFTDWVQDGEYVYVESATGCTVEYLISPEPHLWGANFARGVQLKLEAVLAKAVSGEFSEAMNLDMQGEAAFQTARTMASKSRSTRRTMRTSSYATARFNRGWGSYGED
jgi:hypothetical protein